VRGKGYALASVAKREVADRSRHARGARDLRDPARAGRHHGPVAFSGTDKVDTVYLQRRVPFKEGDPYEPAKVDALRDRLTSLGTFSVVRPKTRHGTQRQGRAADRCRAAGTARRAPSALASRTRPSSASRSMATGSTATCSARPRAFASPPRSTASAYGAFPGDLGYAFKADFKKPDWWASGQDGLASLVASRDVFPAYTRKGGQPDRRHRPHPSIRTGE